MLLRSISGFMFGRVAFPDMYARFVLFYRCFNYRWLIYKNKFLVTEIDIVAV